MPTPMLINLFLLSRAPGDSAEKTLSGWHFPKLIIRVMCGKINVGESSFEEFFSINLIFPERNIVVDFF